ncbi:hypothetical protein [Paraburkholderia kururiensis]
MMKSENSMPSDRARVSAQRKARLQAGWTEVRVWAASRDDVQAIRDFSEELRMKRLTTNVRRIGRELNTPVSVIERAMSALNLQGSSDYNTPSGATLALLTELAREDRLADLNAVVAMFKVVHPGNARFVADSVPAKVMSNNIAHRLDSRGSERIVKWTASNTDWTEELLAALDSFTLDAWAASAIREMLEIKLN